MQINFVPSDNFTPGGAPLPPPVYHERVERPIVHPKFNDPPSSAVRRPSPSASTPVYPPAQARPTPRHSQEERPHSNGWTTAILSPSSGAESVDEEVTYQGTPSVKGNVNATPHSSAGTGSPPETEPRGTGGDRVMSIGTLLLSHGPPNQSYERRGARGHGMDVDGEEQVRRVRRYD